MANIFKEAKKIQRVHKTWTWQRCIQEASKRHKTKKVGAARKVKRKPKQTGTSNVKFDRMYKALPPGPRIPAGGDKVTYHEYRKNRTDAPGKLTGVTTSALKAEIKDRLKISLGKQLVQKELAKTKRQKNKIQKSISATRAELKKLI